MSNTNPQGCDAGTGIRPGEEVREGQAAPERARERATQETDRAIKQEVQGECAGEEPYQGETDGSSDF